MTLKQKRWFMIWLPRQATALVILGITLINWKVGLSLFGMNAILTLLIINQGKEC